MRFNNTGNLIPGSNITYVSQYNANIGFIQEVYNAFYDDSRVAQALNPSRMLSRIPGNSYDMPNIWNQPKPQGLRETLYQSMKQHNNHFHITIYAR